MNQTEWQEKYKEWMAAQSEMTEKANSIFKRYCALENELGLDASCCTWSGQCLAGFTDDVMEFHGDEFWSYGGHEAHYTSLPATWLFNPDWEVEAKQKIQQQVDKFVDKILQDRRAEESRERAQLAALQKKFPS